MARHSTLPQLLRRVMEREGWSAHQLAKRAGIAPSALSALLHDPERVPRLDTIEALAQAIDVPLYMLIQQCGFDLQLTVPRQIKQDIWESLADILDFVELRLTSARQAIQHSQEQTEAAQEMVTQLRRVAHNLGVKSQ
jgi:transcriptional regulator with XRE-family HTH domain